VKLVNQYIIPFTGLKEGNHEFSFTFDKKFFDEFTVLEARKGSVTAEVLLEKKGSLLSLNTCISGKLEIQCDRCLDYFHFPIEFRGDLLVKFGKNTSSGTDEIWILDPNEYELDLKQYFFECIGLCLPIQRIHPQNPDGTLQCNREMISILETHYNQELEKRDTDPRWDKLKELLNDNNN